MTRSPHVATFFGSALRLHGSWALMVPGVAFYSFLTYPWPAALFYLCLLFATGFCLLLHELAHKAVAWCFGIGTRDITVGPFWGFARLTHISERPWQENYIALAGPVTHLVLAGLFAAGLTFAGHELAFKAENEAFDGSLFAVHLFWMNVLLALFNCLPFLPLDGGNVFRATLAMTTSRLRATEIAAILSTIGAVGLSLFSLFWLQSPLLAFCAVLLYFAAQEERRWTRFFASLTTVEAMEAPSMNAPTEQVLHTESQPTEPNYTGFTWNPKLRLWIEWRNGTAVRANALVGE